MPKQNKTEYKVYKFVCKNPGNNTYYISKKLDMSGGRVRHALCKLKKVGLIRFRFDRNNPRIRKLTYPVETLKLLPRGIKKQLKKIR